MISLNAPIESVPKVSRRIVPALKKLRIKTVRDLLFHFPARYDDFSNKKNIREVEVGDTVTVQGQISKIQTIRTARKHMVIVQANIKDSTGSLRATWFNQPFLARILKEGTSVALSGKVALGPNGKYLQNPAYEKIYRSPTSNGKSDFTGALHTGGLIPIYPETRGLTSRWLRFLIKNLIDFRKELTDPLPPETRKKYLLPEVREAVRSMHFPKNKTEAERARHRFNFEELLLIQLRALHERMLLKRHSAPAIPLNLALVKEFVGSLPYQLTDAQRRSMWEIFQDMARPRPMNRLLEGDVGSGKTVVAAAAALLTIKQGLRVAFMAPTEILARQHYETLKKTLAPFAVRIGLLIGAEKKLADDSQIVVGTHALIQKNVRINNLGLVIVDEQHRFGVNQRAALVRGQTRTDAILPHFLSMSATPIPRTLALTIYGDLDLSILDEMPKNRKSVLTKIVEPEKRQEAYQFIHEEVKKGRQAFVICPRIEIANPKSQITNNFQNQNSKPEQQKLTMAEVKAVKEEYKKLKEDVFKDLRVGMLHGKLPAKGARLPDGQGSASGGKSKEQVMKEFREGRIDILVSTSVVEVGVDIPNATIMMIEGAERFGLATLHQFRGRVGRGADQSYCFLFPTEDSVVTKRLRAVVEAKNGFELAEKDLGIRGPGEIFGTRQWGVSDNILAALMDAKLVREVRQEAVEILKKDPPLAAHPELKKRLDEMEKVIHAE